MSLKFLARVAKWFKQPETSVLENVPLVTLNVGGEVLVKKYLLCICQQYSLKISFVVVLL